MGSSSSLSFPKTDVRGLKVLVIEDDDDMRELHVLALAGAGAEPFPARNAHEALELLETHTFDAIVSDVGLPDLDGFELMRRVRLLPSRNAKIPALAVTALGEEHHVAAASRAGFHAHARKPLDPRDLVLAVAFLAPRAR
jgi:CheY-like chemotaxis protein